MFKKESYNFENEINNFFTNENFENLLKKYPPFNDNNKYEVKKIETDEFKYYGEVIKINNEFIPHGRGLKYIKYNEIKTDIYYKGQFINGEAKGNCIYYRYCNNNFEISKFFNGENFYDNYLNYCKFFNEIFYKNNKLNYIIL
jgi:hypothetical protein